MNISLCLLEAASDHSEGQRMKKYLQLFLIFAKIGAVTFGGGYAMLPILQRELVENRHWVTDEELADYFAIGQCTPGVIAVNTATFIGSKLYGVPGGIVATIGVVFPSIIIITVIALFLSNFAHLAAVKHAFNGIRACVTILIADSVVKLGKKSLVDYRCVIIFLIVLAISMFTSVSPVFLVLFAGLAGFIVCPRKRYDPKFDPDSTSPAEAAEAAETVSGSIPSEKTEKTTDRKGDAK